MPPTPRMPAIGVAWFSAIIFIWLAAITTQASQYTTTDLGTLGGTTSNLHRIVGGQT
jgi:hypothetical protein